MTLGTKDIMRPLWRPTKTYIYTSSEDPFCVTEVRYDTWWFRSAKREEHCIEEMQKLNCVFMYFDDRQDDVEFAQVKRIVRCIGMRHKIHDIKHQQGGWKRVWVANYTSDGNEIYPNIMATPIIAVRTEGVYTYYNIEILNYGLVYYAEYSMMQRIVDFDGDRNDVPHYHFIATKTQSFWRSGDEALGIRFAKNACNEIIGVGKCRDYTRKWCTSEHVSLNDSKYAFWGHGGIPCRKAPTLMKELINTHEKLIVEDQTTSWWKAMFVTLSNTIKNWALDLIYAVVGTDWQSKLLKVLIVIYVSKMIFKSDVIAIALGIIYFISGFV